MGDKDEKKSAATGGGNDGKSYNYVKDGYDEEGNNKNDGEWHITDRVYAPTEPGEYILQWRWDNEQTPQIWTTCADISVVENKSSDVAGENSDVAVGRASLSVALGIVM